MADIGILILYVGVWLSAAQQGSEPEAHKII